MKFEEYTPQQAFDHLLGKEVKRIGWPKAFGTYTVVAVGSEFVFLEHKSIELDGEYVDYHPFSYKRLLEEFQLENKPVGMYNMEDSDYLDWWYEHEGLCD